MGTTPVRGRTSIDDFAEALLLIDARLEKYEPVKKSAWLGQSVSTHLEHADEHLGDAIWGWSVVSVIERVPLAKDRALLKTALTAATLRCLMALDRLLEWERQQGESDGG